MDNMMRTDWTGTLDVRELRSNMVGEVVIPGDESWDEARRAWNLAVDQRPVAVAIPETVQDVVELVTYARDCGLQVAPQGTGHSAGALGSLAHTILLKMHKLRGVTIDPVTRTARAEAGTIWIEVVESAAEHGLAALAGSSPDVGVVGYTLGGGLSFLARKHGIGANQVTAVEIVTADGEHRRADRENDPDLFWAVRGGGGAFGVVTAIEFDLFPLTEVYAGILWFPVERAAEILRAWRDWTDEVPDEMTSVGRILQLPPIEAIPEPVRGKSFVIVETIYCGGDHADGERLAAPLRALGPVMDTVTGDADREALAAAHGSGGSRRAHRGRGRRRADPVGGDPPPRRRSRPRPRRARRRRRVRRVVLPVRGRDGSDTRGRRRGRGVGARTHRGGRAVGRRPHVLELRRLRPRRDHALDGDGASPAAPRQGGVRPAERDPVEPPDPVTAKHDSSRRKTDGQEDARHARACRRDGRVGTAGVRRSVRHPGRRAARARHRARRAGPM